MSIIDFSTYTADSIFGDLPQFIQDADASGYLYAFLKAVGNILDQQVNFLARDNMGAGVGQGLDGTTDPVNYGGAPGWSQVVDIDRCPGYALPWLAQFVGVRLDPATQVTYDQQVAAIKTQSLFARGTVASVVSAIVAWSAGSAEPILTDQVIVMEQTEFVSRSGGGINTYQFSPYAAVVLTPGGSATLYGELLAKAVAWWGFAPGSPLTYTQFGAYVTSLGGTYGDLIETTGTTPPALDSLYNLVIAPYRPAGLQIYLGGY